MKDIQRRRILGAVLAALLLAVFAVPAAADSAENPDFYGIGLSVVSVLDEMVQSPDYLNLFLQNEEASSLVNTSFNTGDYGSPAAVYRLEQKDPRAWVLSQMGETEKAILENLSPALQDQLWRRMEGLSMIVNRINILRGSLYLAVTSSLQAMLDEPDLEMDGSASCLFVFPKGVPILVSYSRHYASGMFLALEEEETQSAEALQALMKTYGVEVTPVDLP